MYEVRVYVGNQLYDIYYCDFHDMIINVRNADDVISFKDWVVLKYDGGVVIWVKECEY